jgi:hypothetical protein
VKTSHMLMVLAHGFSIICWLPLPSLPACPDTGMSSVASCARQMSPANTTGSLLDMQ